MTNDATGDSVDRIVQDLQRLRADAGAPSYAEIVRRIAATRQAEGVPDLLARPARTTVYDAFRQGRSRLDPDLVGDIAQALGGDRQGFRRRSLRVRLASEVTTVTLEGPAGPATDEPPSGAGDPDPVRAPGPEPRPTQQGTAYRVVIVLSCLALNLLGYVAVDAFDLAIYLDMTGTGIAAIGLGPWHGVLVAVLTHLVGMSVHGVMSVPFVLVNIAGALIWGYGVRRFRQGRSLPRFFGLTLLVAAASSAVATPILLLLFGGGTGHSASLVEGLIDLGEPFGLAVLHANLMMSVADKLIAGFVILTAAAWLSRYVPIPGGRVFVVLGSLSRQPPSLTSSTNGGPTHG